MKPKRGRIDRREVKAWMIMRELKPRDIQEALALKHHSQVVETLLGDRNDRRVLAWLRDNGCPIEALKLPKNMLEKHS